jgi:hypothetical protein
VGLVTRRAIGASRWIVWQRLVNSSMRKKGLYVGAFPRFIRKGNKQSSWLTVFHITFGSCNKINYWDDCHLE